MAQILDAWVAKGKYGKLLELWVKGLAFDWRRLYGEARPRRISLPTYPFARERYWVDRWRASLWRQGITRGRRWSLDAASVAASEHVGSVGAAVQHKADRGGVLSRDHVVDGARVLPGVAHLEMARAAAEAATAAAAAGKMHLRNVTWLRPVVVGTEGLELHIELVADEEGRIDYEIYSGAAGGGDDARVIYSQGRVVVGSAIQVADLDIGALQTTCANRTVPVEDCYALMEAQGILHGESHRAMTALSVGTDEKARTQVLAQLELPACVESTSGDYVLHPSLMGGALQASIGLSLTGESSASSSVPFALEEVWVNSRCPAHGFAWVRPQETAPGKLDIDVCDEAGQVCVRLRGYITRAAIAKTSNSASTGTLLAKRIWRAREPEAFATPAYEQHLIVACGVTDWTRELDAEVRSALPHARCIVIADDEKEIGRRYEAAVLQVSQVLQQIVRDRPRDDVLIQAAVGVSGQDALLGGLSGLLKAARQEHPKLKGQVIGFEADASAAQIVMQLQKSARAPQQEEVRYRGGERKVRSWQELPSDLAREVPWRESGVYLVTGGAGGLGLIFAEAIARDTRDAVIVLTGRSELDERRRARLSAIEGLGARVEYRVVDVADAEAVRSLIASMRENHGGVTGIIHAAGVHRDRFLLKKTPEEVRAVLAPKVAGVLNLDEATRELTLEFMVLFSSGAGSFPYVGQSDYAAANAFLDRYAAYRNELVRHGERWGRTVSIAWPWWRDGGMHLDAAGARLHREAGMLQLETASGLQAFYQALSAGEDEIAVLAGELSLLREHLSGAAAAEQRPKAEPTVDRRVLVEKTLHRLKGVLSEVAQTQAGAG